MNFEIITDSCSNLSYKLVHKYNIKVMPIKYMLDGEEHDTYYDTVDESWQKEFYTVLRQKAQITTSCINEATYVEVFEEYAKEGKDFIYFGFSGALSQTSRQAQQAVEALRPKYPERKMYAVDTKSCAFGQGLLVDYIARHREAGKSIDEVYDWAEKHKLNIVHWFTVDDLFFLKRGGRISATTAIAGTLLGIKPVMHVDDEGRLINVDKARGRKQALIELVNRMEKSAIEPENQRVFICHGDCLDDCNFVMKLVKEHFGVKDFEINMLNPVIGAHSGPGTVALFFFGKER